MVEKAFSAFKSLDKKKNVKPNFTVIKNAILSKQQLDKPWLRPSGQDICLTSTLSMVSPLETSPRHVLLSKMLLLLLTWVPFCFSSLNTSTSKSLIWEKRKKANSKTRTQHSSPSTRQNYPIIFMALAHHSPALAGLELPQHEPFPNLLFSFFLLPVSWWNQVLWRRK